MSVLLYPQMKAPPAPPPASRTDRFLERVDLRMAELPAHERLAFIDQMLGFWTRDYARFLSTEGRSHPSFKADDPPHCTDFLLTIAGLAKRRALLAEPKS